MRGVDERGLGLMKAMQGQLGQQSAWAEGHAVQPWRHTL